MTRLTTTQKTQLNNMNKASQRGTLGTRIDELEYGTIADPDTGTIAPIAIIKYSTTPAIGTATYVHAAVTLGTGTTTVTTAITNPDVPRIATIKGNAGGIAGNVVITGTDVNDSALTDTIALDGSNEVLGVKAFKTITQFVLPAKTNGSGDTVSIGVGNKIGFLTPIYNASLVIAKTFNGSADGGTVTAASTTAASIFEPAGTLNGARILELIFAVP